MVNYGPDTNAAGFLISFAETKWLDEKHVVFGSVLDEESLAIVGKMHDVATSSGEPLDKIIIKDCGQVYL